jgi:hypothetical protein
MGEMWDTMMEHRIAMQFYSKKKGMLHAKEKIVVYTFYTGLFETSQKKKD